MKFLLDENTAKSLARFFTQLDHTVFRIKKIHPGAEDFQVLELAVEKGAILVTLDRDFGELVFKEGKVHSGVIFLRLDNQGVDNIKKAMSWLLSKYPENKILNSFTVITEKEGKFRARILQVVNGKIT